MSEYKNYSTYVLTITTSYLSVKLSWLNCNIYVSYGLHKIYK